MNDQALAELVLASSPNAVVLVGEPVFRLSAPIMQVASAAKSPLLFKSACVEEAIDAASGTDLSAADLAMCVSLPADSLQPESVLGLACRASPQMVLVEHVENKAKAGLFGDEQFFAFGFRRLGSAKDASGLQRSWYGYRLSDYKQSPEWLNARFWAHPERFDLPD